MKSTNQFAELDRAGPFTLGSVQLGMPYGLGSAQRLLSVATVAEILSAATCAGIKWIDTAAGYGESEKRIGDLSADNNFAFRIASKLPPLVAVDPAEIAQEINGSIARSLRQLRRPRIEVYLAHRGTDILRPEVATLLRRAQDAGQIGRFGASVYTVDEAKAAMRVQGLGALQVPLSVVMPAFISSGIIGEAAESGIAVFARSVFLQGALLLPPENLPAHLTELGPVNARLRAIADEAAITVPSLLIGAVKSVPGVYSVVLGVDDPAQLSELVAAAVSSLDVELSQVAISAASGLSPEVTDPRRWPQISS